MTFQKTVLRQYTTGFPGEIIKDGPTRAKSGIIASATVGTDPAASTNRMSRAFGYTSDVPAQGVSGNAAQSVYPAMEANVSVGGPVFYGILGDPKQYALSGTSAGSLAPTQDLPQYLTASFFDMGILVAELFNETTATKAVNFGDQIAYVMNTITGGQNLQVLPYGALVSVAPGGSAATGMVLIPNARVVNAISLAASAVGGGTGLVSGYTVIQLTQ